MLGGEGERAVRERPTSGGRGPERSRRTEPGAKPGGLDDAVGEGLPSRTPASAARGVGVLEGEAVEVDEGLGGSGVGEVLEAEGVRALEEERGGDVDGEGVGLHAVEGGLGDGGSVDGDADVVVGVDVGVAAALEVDGEPGGGARGRRRRRGRRGRSWPCRRRDAVVPEPEVLGLEEGGEVVGVLLEGAGASGAKRGARAAAVRRSGRGRRRRRPCGGRRRRRRARRRRRWCRRRRRPRRGRRGWSRGRSGRTGARRGRGRRHPGARGACEAVSSMRLEEARSGAPEEVAARRSSQRDGVEALGAGDEAGEERARARRLTAEAEAAADGAAEAGLAGDDAVEDDGDEEPAGEDEAAAGGVEAQRERARRRPSWCRPGRRSGGRGPGRGGRGRGREQRRPPGGSRPGRCRRASRRPRGAPAVAGTRPSKVEEVLGRDGGDAGAEADDGVGPGAAGGERGVAGLGEVEEAGDEEPLRAVLLGEGVEAAGRAARRSRSERVRSTTRSETSVGSPCVVQPRRREASRSSRRLRLRPESRRPRRAVRRRRAASRRRGRATSTWPRRSKSSSR